MKTIFIFILTTGMVTSCGGPDFNRSVSSSTLHGRKTIDVVSFLRLYLAQAPPGQSECGWYAYPEGVHDKYHHMEVSCSNFGSTSMLFGGPAFTDRRYRCLATDLPKGFPGDLRDIASHTRSNFTKRELVVDMAIESYLKSANKLTEETIKTLAITPEDRTTYKGLKLNHTP